MTAALRRWPSVLTRTPLGNEGGYSPVTRRCVAPAARGGNASDRLRSSVQAEAFGTDEGAEIRPLRLRILPRLVLGPAVLRRRAVVADIALTGIRLNFRSAPVVAVDARPQVRFIEMVVVDGDR